jgi:hypothetical protein
MVPGDTVVIELLSDRFINDYGFIISQISPDTDGDLVADKEEVLEGSNPLSSDHFFIDLEQGMNLFSYPIEMAAGVTARSLKETLGCDKFSRYNREQERLQEASEEDFVITSGEGYVVQMSASREKVHFSGSPWSSPITVMKGLNLTALPWHIDNYDAYDVVSDLSKNGNRVSLQRFNSSIGSFETASIMNNQPVGVRFTIRAGGAYFLFSEQDVGLWWPSFLE